jgi:hypothetical protein
MIVIGSLSCDKLAVATVHSPNGESAPVSHDELIATLQYCLAVIREHLADEHYQHQRWFWELRENVALYALRSQLYDLRDLDVPPLSAEQRQNVLQTHPLLASHQPMPAPATSPQQQALQQTIRRKLAQSYLAAPSLPPVSTPGV